MPTTPDALQTIARARQRDPLAPVTVIAPSRVAAIQLRRRLAEIGPFAGVRFETLPRLAELLGAADLARAGRAPLARPIGDYLASQVAHEARSDLAEVRDLGGFARVLRQSFKRLREGGFRRPEEVRSSLDSGLLAELARLYGRFRTLSGDFYDAEDLLDAATSVVQRGGPSVIEDLGEIYVLPPGALSAGADSLLKALRRAAGPSRFRQLSDPALAPATNFVLAPDPASEAREAAREVLQSLEAGGGLHEVAVFHGGDPAYRSLLAGAFEAAEIPVVPMPGAPLSETAAGRSVLALAELPLADYSRTALFDWLGVAPLRPQFDGKASGWRRLAAEAGVTRGSGRWESNLRALIANARYEADKDEERRERAEARAADGEALHAFVSGLIARLEPLRRRQPAAGFIEDFKDIVSAYLDRDAAALDEVNAQIEQLGTIDAVGGTFDLLSFAAALRANLDAAYFREGRLGDGVLLADYRLAAGLSYRHVVVCGAYEGVFPAGSPQEPLVEDRFWTRLQQDGHPFLEDAALRQARAREAAQRAVAATFERLTWTAPLQASGAGREHYPSQLMLEAAREREPSLASATALRTAPASAWLRRPASPLAATLTGLPVEVGEARLRGAVTMRRDGATPHEAHPLRRPLQLLARRHGAAFSEFDGNLSALAAEELVPSRGVSPTSLEHYAVCGLRYFLNSVLRLRPPEEPDDRDTIDPRDKGTLVHEVLDTFFKQRLAEGRPAVGESWGEEDRAELMRILEAALEEARNRGRTGLDVFAEHERRRLRAELSAFLEHDTAFRLETGARPVGLEQAVPERDFGGIRLRGIVDRIDMTPNGREAWVLDYKTGSTRAYDAMKDEDPLAKGTRLQLPVYRFAVPADVDVQTFYWFIGTSGGFEKRHFDPDEANMQRFEATLRAILDAVGRGVFPAVPGEEDARPGYSFANCAYCDFNRLCSTRRDGEFETKREDPAMRAWFGVAEAALGGAP